MPQQPDSSGQADEHAVDCIWDEQADGLVVRLPPPIAEQSASPKVEKGCAIAVFAFGLVLLLSVVLWTLALCWENPGSLGSWLIAVIAIGGAIVFQVYLFKPIRECTSAPAAPEPTMLTIRNGTFKVERAGLDGDTDVTWSVSEIRDLRLCATSEEPALPTPRALLRAALFGRKDLVRISVQLPSGSIEDVIVRAQGQHWIEELERSLRAHLSLA